MLRWSCGNSEVFGDIWWEQRPQPLNLHPENTQRPKRKFLKAQNVVCSCSCVRIAATVPQVPAGFPSPSPAPDPRASRENINMHRVSPDPGEGGVHEATHRAVHTAAFHPFSSGFQAPFSAQGSTRVGLFCVNSSVGTGSATGIHPKAELYTETTGNKQTNILQCDRN